MTGKDLEAANRVGQEPQVEVKEIPMGDVPATLSVAPISVDIYRFPVVGAAQRLWANPFGGAVCYNSECVSN